MTNCRQSILNTALITTTMLLMALPALSSTWGLSGWSYRKSHTINSATGAGTNYQVMITVYYGNGTDANGNVYCNSKCLTDFADIRFTASDGATLLNYWMESYTANTSAVFWVQVQADLSSSSQTIFIYYGKTGETTTSSGANTFLFYSDWEDNTLQGWTIIKYGTANGTVTTLNSSYQLDLYAPSTSYRVQANKSYSSNPGIMIESKMTTSSTVGDGVFIGFSDGTMGGTSDDSPNNGYFFSLARNGNSRDQINKKSGGTFSELTYTNNSINVNTSYFIGLSWESNNTLRGFRNRSQVLTATDNSFSSQSYVFVSADWYDKYYDWVYVRKYVNPEPTHGTWSAEDQPMVLSSSKTDATCYLKPDGTATVAVTSGGYSPFTYSWNSTPPQTITTATGLPAGTYTATVTDFLGLTGTINATVGQPNAVTATASPLVNISCYNGSDGKITVNASGGTPDYLFSIDNGGSWTADPGKTSHTFENLTAGSNYQIRVKDSNGCMSPEIP